MSSQVTAPQDAVPTTNRGPLVANLVKLQARFLSHPAAAIFAIGLLTRLFLVLALRTYLHVEHTEVVNIATSLATKGTYANAFFNGAPTAHASPLYPLMLSIVFRIFGTGVAGEFAQELLSCVLCSAMYATLPGLSRACDMGVEVGAFAGIAGALLRSAFGPKRKGRLKPQP